MVAELSSYISGGRPPFSALAPELIDELPPAIRPGNKGRPSKDGRNHHFQNLDREFIAWDGEGINHDGEGRAQSFVLFGASTGDYVRAFKLGTEECLELMLNVSAAHKNAIHVGFAFKYDTEMILHELPIPSWYRLREHGQVRWKGYLIQYLPGKWLKVVQGRKAERRSILLYDVFGFFQSSFIKALKGWMPASDLDEIESIQKGKDDRPRFKYRDLDDEIMPYWESELRLLVKLMNRLRELLIAAEVCPSRWHGAGAIATQIYGGKNTRSMMSRTDEYPDPKIDAVLPQEVYEAGRYAYGGGRFELFYIGHYPEKVYQYDLNSAYPKGISLLPNLAVGEWRHVGNPDFDPRLFAVWEIRFDGYGKTRKEGSAKLAELMADCPPMPAFHRDHKGRVSFPWIVNTWQWSPETAMTLEYVERYGGRVKIVSAWIFEHNDERPFEFVAAMYDQRQEWKAAGNPAEKALKLALNSLYGKMAQRKGFHKEDNRLPPYYQLEWAGYVTSFTRAKIGQAIMQAGLRNIISIETDAVFSKVPIELPVSTNLGEWSLEVHDYMTTLQSGMYFTEKGAKYRGLDPGSLTEKMAMDWLRAADWAKPIASTSTRFIGAGRGLGTPKHRAWLTEPKEIVPGKMGKRIHRPGCEDCKNGVNPAEGLHRQKLCGMRDVRHSFMHRLPWEPSEFRELDEMEVYDASD